MLKYFSTFTGVGGLDIGLEEMKAKCVGFSEIKKTSIAIYKSHYPEHKNYGDLTEICFEELPDFDILTGGFPCQSFSLAGLRKGFEDSKGKKGAMVLYLYNLLVAKQPQYFVLENVKGILNHDGGKTYAKIFRLFENAGYHVRVILLNSLYYGSAQNRERVIFLGSKTEFQEKRPESMDDTKRFKDVLDSREAVYKPIHDTERNKLKIEQLLQFKFELIGEWDRVGTLTTHMGCGDKAVPYKEWYRMLTPLECERLQNFPDDWTAGVADSARYFAMGNAVNCNVSRYLFGKYLKGLWY